MSLLKDRAVAYKERFVRANALDVGNVILYDETQFLVVKIDRDRFIAVDEQSDKIAANIRRIGANDKVSPNFDDAIRVTVALLDLRDEDGRVVAQTREKELLFPEWEVVRVFS